MANENNRYGDAFGASDGGQFSTGTAALLKLAKALFYLLTTVIVILIIVIVVCVAVVVTMIALNGKNKSGGHGKPKTPEDA